MHNRASLRIDGFGGQGISFFIGLRGELGFYCFSGELICDLIAIRARAARNADYDFPSMALGGGN